MATQLNIQDLLDQPQMRIGARGEAIAWWNSALVADASSAALTTHDVAVITDLWQEEVDGVLTPYVMEVYTGSAASVAVDVAQAFPDPDLPGVPLVADQFALDFITKTTSGHFGGVGSELWEDVRNELLDGVSQGQSIPQIAARIRAVGNYTERHSVTVARTVVHSAAESGNVAQMKFMGYTDDEVEKEWVSTLGDGRTRPTHITANGQTVPLGEKFVVGGWKLDHPGVWDGPADEIINCRCTTTFNFVDPPKNRCGGLTAAGSDPDFCVIPVKKPSISHLLTPGPGGSIAQLIFNTFMKHKITPAYGGAKIQKTLDLARAELGDLVDGVTDLEMLASIDHYHTSKGAFTFFEKWVDWAQSPAGMKALSGKKPIIAKAVKAPIVTPSSVGPAPKLKSLPPIPAKPDPAKLTFTGKTLGSHGAQVWIDQDGNRWLFKPQSDFMASIDVATAQLQSKALQTRPGVYKITLNGKSGSIQSMFQSIDAFPSGFIPTQLADADALALQRAHIFDWLVGNHDAHAGQFVRSMPDGTLVDVDKGQSFKFLGKDKLDWDYVAPGNVGTPVYNLMWKAFVQGKNVPLVDPTTGELGAFIDHIMAIPDAEYRDLFRAYALGRGMSGKQLDDFLDQIVARKNSLKSDFTLFWQRAVDARKKSLGVTPPAPKPPAPPKIGAPAPTPLGDGGLGDISGVSASIKKVISNQWVAFGAGKKVTPAWGGAKIYKMLKDMKTWAQGDSELELLTDLQILRILDDVGGYKGKSKTYESVVFDWLAEPKSTATTAKVGLPDASLKPEVLKPVAPPVVPPAATVVDEATEVLATGSKADPWDLLASLPKYKDDDVVAYIMTKNGDMLRAIRVDATTMKIELRKSGTDKWVHDNGFSSSEAAALAGEYNVDGPGLWSLTKPTATIGKSIIPGKMPHDDVTSSEIWASRYLWKDGDVIATFANSTMEHKVLSDGMGGLAFFTRKPGEVDWQYLALIPHDDPHGWDSPLLWKLTGDVLKEGDRPSVVLGKTEGDVISVIDVYAAGIQNQSSPTSTVIAYAYDQYANVEFRVVTGGGTGFTNVQARIVSQQTTWDHYQLVHTPDDMQFGKSLTWRVAKPNGQAPDSHLAALPKTTTVPMKETAHPKWFGFSVGDEVDELGILNAHADFNDYEVVALGTDALGTEYRVYNIDGQLVLEYKNSGGGWTAGWVVKTEAELKPTYSTVWTAPKLYTVPSSHVGAKDLKKMLTKPPKKTAAPAVAKVTPAKAAPPPPPAGPAKKMLHGNETNIPGKSSGDTTSSEEVLAHFESYHEGKVIAMRSTWNGNFRLMMINGKLVQQKQTSAGAWGTTKVINTKWDTHGTTGWTLAPADDFATPQQIKAAKKAVDKATGVAQPVTAAKKGKTTTSAGSSAANVGNPIQLAHVDITQWTDAEQEEIFQFFKGKNVYVSSSPDHIWSAVQAVKSTFQAKYKGKYLNLNEVEILRIADARGAFKASVQDTHPLETKVVNWLKTSAGRATVSKSIDAPLATRDIPMPMMALDDPSNPHPDTQSYPVITLAQARQYRAEDHARHGTWRPGEKEAQRIYTGGSYTAWNAAIRAGDLGPYRAKIIKAQQGMRPSTRPMMLHRGCSFRELNDPSITSYQDLLRYVGRTYVNRGFNSASVGGHAAFGGDLLIEFECPIGTPMTHVQDFSQNPGENETLLPAHLIYQILSVKKASNGRTTVMRVRVIGAADPNA